jgi:hypothetical protein
MKTFVQLLIFVALGIGAYFYFHPHPSSASVKNSTPPPSAPPKVDIATGKPLIACPRCGGTGQVKCKEPFCKDGKVDCPGPCLKLSKGIWEKRQIDGQASDELWQSIPPGSKQFLSQAHCGEIPVVRGGQLTTDGVCKICKGTTKVPCSVCHGTALVICPLCKGQKEIPDPRAPNPTSAQANAQKNTSANPASTPHPPETIHLKNGTTITGNVVIKDAESVVIRMADGKTTQISAKELATEPSVH